MKNGRNALLAVLTLLFTGIAGVAQPPIDVALHDLASRDLNTRTNALYMLLPPANRTGMRLEVNALLGAYPGRAEQIRTALITALEAQGAEYEDLVKNNTEMSESFVEYWMVLTDAVASLKDLRAVRGLLLSTGSVGLSAVDGLADICPTVVDSIIERSHGPEMYFEGSPLHVRGQAINVLGNCLRRPATNFSPDAWSKIKKELIAGLDDVDWNVRALSAEALIPLREDLAVQAKLQSLAQTDSYLSPTQRPGDVSPFAPVRTAAARALNPPSQLLYYITRTPESRVVESNRHRNL